MLFAKVIFIPLNLHFYKLQDVFHILQIVLLIGHLLLEVLYSFTVLLVKIFEGIDEICILEGDQGLLEDPEIESLNLLDSMAGHPVRESLKHQHYVHVLVH